MKFSLVLLMPVVMYGAPNKLDPDEREAFYRLYEQFCKLESTPAHAALRVLLNEENFNLKENKEILNEFLTNDIALPYVSVFNPHTCVGKYTLLMEAATQGHYKLVRKLIKYGADVNARDDEGRSVLMYAIRGGNIRSIISLLRAGACNRHVSDPGETPLTVACHKGNSTVIKILLTSFIAKLSLCSWTNQIKQLPFHNSVIAQELNGVTLYGVNPLCIVLDKFILGDTTTINPALVSVLLDAGAEVNQEALKRIPSLSKVSYGETLIPLLLSTSLVNSLFRNIH